MHCFQRCRNLWGRCIYSGTQRCTMKRRTLPPRPTHLTSMKSLDRWGLLNSFEMRSKEGEQTKSFLEHILYFFQLTVKIDFGLFQIQKGFFYIRKFSLVLYSPIDLEGNREKNIFVKIYNVYHTLSSFILKRAQLAS